MKKKNILFISSGILLIIISIILLSPKISNETGEQLETPVIDSGQVNLEITNPASTNCINSGGRLELKDSVGICHFEDGSMCEEWAYFRGDCAEGDSTFCGGIMGKICPKPLTCKYDGDYPDAGGTCILE